MCSFTKTASASIPYRGSAPGPRWGTSVPVFFYVTPNNPVRSMPLHVIQLYLPTGTYMYCTSVLIHGFLGFASLCTQIAYWNQGSPTWSTDRDRPKKLHQDMRRNTGFPLFWKKKNPRVFQSNFRIFQVLSVIFRSRNIKKYEKFITDVHHSFLCNTN